MAPPKFITSLQNERVKALVRLRSGRERRKHGLTIVEEPLVIRRGLKAGLSFSEIWYCPEQEASATSKLRAEICHEPFLDPETGLPISTPELFEVPPHVMDKIAYREHSEGLLAVASIPHHSLADVTFTSDHSPLVVVVESLEKPGNLGAVQRIADGAGADAVLVCGEGTDLYNPNVLRASRGACFHVSCLAAPESEIRRFLSEHGLRILATTPQADHSWDEVDLTGPVALILGAEHEGLSESWLTQADLRVALPMLGVGDSLNISTTAAIVLYECVRQRTSQGRATR